MVELPKPHGGSDLRSTIARELAAGKSEDEVVELLRARGLSEGTARRFLASVTGAVAVAGPRTAEAAPPPSGDRQPRSAAVRSEKRDEADGTWRMTLGVLFLVGGLAFTGLTYVLARPGGKVLLLWGAVAYGFVDVCRGAARWWEVRERVAFPLARVLAAAVVPSVVAGALMLFSPRGVAARKEAEQERTREEILEALREHREKRFPGRTPTPDRPALGTTVPALIEGLSSPDAFTRRTAAQRLGFMEGGAAPAISALTAALGDSDPQVRASVLYALGKIDPSGARSAPFVSQRLTDNDPEVRVEAGRALSRMGIESGIEGLVKELQNSEPRPRELAASALETVDTTRAVPALIHCVSSDSSPRARASCVLALRRGGPASVRALPALAKALEDPDPQVQKWAVMVYEEVARIERAQPRAAAP